MSTKGLGVNGSEVNGTLVLGCGILERLTKSFALLGSFGENVSEGETRLECFR